MLYKRSKKAGAKYWCRFSIGGEEFRVSCGTASKADAEEFEQALRLRIWRERQLGEVLHTWEEAKTQWIADKARKKSLKRDREAFAALDAVLAGVNVADIDKAMIRSCEQHLTNTPILKGKTPHPRSPATVARIMAVLRSVLRRAVKEWEWITHAPHVSADSIQPEPRWITEAQFDELWRELPMHAQQIVRYMVAMGPRSANVFRLRWVQVDRAANVVRISGNELKGKKPVAFPIAPDAAVVLDQQRGAHPEYVFTDHKGRAPLKSIRTCWRKACKRAGVPGLRVHDLRHTFAAWHKLAGTPDGALQALGGWSSPKMVKHYGHITPEGYSQYSDNRRTKNGTGGGTSG